MNSIGQIGVLMPEITDPLDYELLRGIQSEAFALGYDVILYCSIYNSQEECQQDSYTEGLENIYTLLMQHRLDGVIYAADRFHNQSLNASIREMLVQSKIPCLVLGAEHPMLQTLYPRQQDGMYRMTKHLITVHGCRNIYCITGFPDERTSEERTAGYRQAMTEFGLPVSADQIFYGQFWKIIPAQIGRQIADGSLPMPDGIVCASDSMATAICQSLRENGIAVPEQISVTGYDGSWDSWVQSPKLTTVVGRDRQFGADAVRGLCEIITGKTLGNSLCEQEIRYGESCGCKPEHIGSNTIDAFVLEQYFRLHIHHSIWQKQFYASDVINRVRNQATLHGWIEAVDKVGHVLDSWQWLDICLCEDWCFDLEHPEICREYDYPPRMLLALSKRRGVNAQEQYLFPTSAILPALRQPHEPKLVLLTSLHNHGQIFGYLATAYDKPEQISADGFYLNWCEAVVNGLDHLQNVMYREYIKSQMELLTVRDPITGLYNRRGFAEQLPHKLSEMRKSKDIPALLLLTWHTAIAPLPYEPLLVVSNALRDLKPQPVFAALLEDSVPIMLCAENQVSSEDLIHQVRQNIKALLGEVHSTLQIVTQTIRMQDATLGEAEQTIMLAASALREQAETAGVDLNDKIHVLRKEIYENPQGDWSIIGIAQQLCISKTHLHRLYKQLFSVNPMDDVILARIQKAKKLLQFTNLRIQEIAQQCGYRNESHFMRQFKEKTGMTALQYRQVHHNE